MTAEEIRNAVLKMLNKKKTYKWHSKSGREIAEFDDGIRWIRWKEFYPYIVLFETDRGVKVTFTYPETYEIIRSQRL